MKYKSSIQITNSSKDSRWLILEPWAEEFELLAGKSFEFLGEGETEGRFDVEFNEDAIIVFGWESSTVKIFCDGEEIGTGNFDRTAVPPLPGKQLMSTFIKNMFGKNK